MPAAARLADVCTGHADFPPRPNDQGSPNVYVNGRPLHRNGDHWLQHCNPVPVCHDSALGGGSATVYANGKRAGRIGDAVACGSTVATGSGDVFIGG